MNKGRFYPWGPRTFAGVMGRGYVVRGAERDRICAGTQAGGMVYRQESRNGHSCIGVPSGRLGSEEFATC